MSSLFLLFSQQILFHQSVQMFFLFCNFSFELFCINNCDFYWFFSDFFLVFRVFLWCRNRLLLFLLLCNFCLLSKFNSIFDFFYLRFKFCFYLSLHLFGVCLNFLFGLRFGWYLNCCSICFCWKSKFWSIWLIKLYFFIHFCTFWFSDFYNLFYFLINGL